MTFRPVTDEIEPRSISTGSRRIAAVSINSRTAGSAISIFPIWERPASANSSNGIIRSSIRKDSSIDVRANGGGNVSRMIIERLSRKVLGYQFYARQSRIRRPIPTEHFPGR